MLVHRPNAKTIALEPVEAAHLRRWLGTQPEMTKSWVEANRFKAKPGEALAIPDEKGQIRCFAVGIDQSHTSWASLVRRLPKGRYRIEGELSAEVADRAALGWGLGAYRFTRYKAKSPPTPELVWPASADRNTVGALLEAVSLARDLINTPASDLGSVQLAAACSKVAEQHGAQCNVIVGDHLLTEGYPAVHAVGRAAADPPRLIDLRWGEEGDPKIALVGKGVCFDTGGLDLKPSSGMKLMKKDMGGAAITLGLASALMAAGARIRLRLLIPAVENSVAGNAMRPLDVLSTRKGIFVEVGNTDAEGRLILADALTAASEWGAEAIFDVATLTGAARVALGTDLPALFTSAEDWAASLLSAGTEVEDPLWRMPLYEPYRPQVDSHVAMLTNSPSGRYGGAITAALFLREFVSKDIPWVHIDAMAYNLEDKPGHPRGGEAMGLRALFWGLVRRYGARHLGS